MVTELVYDLIAVAIFGLLGGLGLGLLQEKGIEMPHWRGAIDKTDKDGDKMVRYFDMGFLADALVGAIAAVAVYALNQPAGDLQLVGSGLASGLGGAGILKSYVEKSRSEEAIREANDAAKNSKHLVSLAKRNQPKKRSPKPKPGDKRKVAGTTDELDYLEKSVDENIDRVRYLSLS